MKKIVSFLLSGVLMVSTLALTGCGNEALKFGTGVYSYYNSASDATAEADGAGEVDSTFAAVLLDKNGKIVQVALDVAQNKVTYKADGTFVASDSYPSKAQKGDNYNMAKFGANQDRNGDGVVLEWYDQRDAFLKLCIGKTIDEVMALVADDHYGVKEVQDAKCTIHVIDFAKAIEAACKNAVDSKATAKDTLNVGVSSEQSHSSKNATAEADGLNQVDATFAAVVKNAKGEVVAIKIDAAQAKFSFDITGKSTLDLGAAIPSKLEQGDNYNMAKFGQSQDKNGDGVVLEWYQQSAAYEEACMGKTSSAISGLVKADGYGVDELQNAKCTITVSGFVEATVDAMK